MSQKERNDITGLHARAPRGVLFTVIAVRGPLCRQAGARFYVSDEGLTAGAAAQACIEALLLQRAREFVRDGAVLRGFSVSLEEATETHYGNGDVDVLAEAAEIEETLALMGALRAVGQREHRTVVTVLPAQSMPLLRFVMDAHDDVLFASEALETEDIVPLRRIALSADHATLHDTRQGRMFVERMTAEDTLEEECMTAKNEKSVCGNASRDEKETYSIYPPEISQNISSEAG